MEFFLLPIHIGLLFLAVPGVCLAAKAFRQSQNKSATLRFFLVGIVAAFLIGMVVPVAGFAFFQRGTASGWFLVIALTVSHLAIALVGCLLGVRSRPAQDQRWVAWGSALLIWAALLPLTMGVLAQPLAKLFGAGTLGG